MLVLSPDTDVPEDRDVDSWPIRCKTLDRQHFSFRAQHHSSEYLRLRSCQLLCLSCTLFNCAHYLLLQLETLLPMQTDCLLGMRAVCVCRASV